MNQSGTIAAALLAGFVLYLAARDRLKVYAAVLWGAGGGAASAPSALTKTTDGAIDHYLNGGTGIVHDIASSAELTALSGGFGN